MAQRNPMNDRYLGDGPQGKTRKSATKLKPKSGAASSVYIEKKPTNKQERKAARKKRDAQLAAKERERKRKAEERDRKAREAAGEVIEDSAPTSMLGKVKNFFIPPRAQSSGKSKATLRQEEKKAAEEAANKSAQEDAKKSPAVVGPLMPTWRKGPDTPQYRKLKYTYWTLMGVGILFVLISLLLMAIPEASASFGGYGTMLPLVVSYPTVIAAMILDSTKIRKMQKAHLAGGTGARRSPKQMKHALQQAEAAVLLEESKKAQKESKRANSKIPFISGKAKTATDTDDSKEASQEDVQDEDIFEEALETAEEILVEEEPAEAVRETDPSQDSEEEQ